MTVSMLPTINACLNGTAILLLLLGWFAIKGNQRNLHRNLMILALTVSAAFLTTYLIYHAQVGSVPYEGQGIQRTIYFLILIPHIILAALMVPFILGAVWFALRGQFDRHKRLVKWVWPVWMYVSVSGVIVYLMLYIF